MSVLHDDSQCTAKSCCNPQHLRVGTHAENIREAIENGAKLGPRSVEGSNSKLTADEVREIRRKSRKEEVTYTDLAEEYDVSYTTIYRCVTRRAYNDID
jgi:DNA invertase Pin-like site-specific DNA recombinase